MTEIGRGELSGGENIWQRNCPCGECSGGMSGGIVWDEGNVTTRDYDFYESLNVADSAMICSTPDTATIDRLYY